MNTHFLLMRGEYDDIDIVGVYHSQAEAEDAMSRACEILAGQANAERSERFRLGQQCGRMAVAKDYQGEDFFIREVPS